MGLVPFLFLSPVARDETGRNPRGRVVRAVCRRSTDSASYPTTRVLYREWSRLNNRKMPLAFSSRGKRKLTMDPSKPDPTAKKYRGAVSYESTTTQYAT
jgi:hypothetical protein